MEDKEYRKQFLINMYNQMLNDINRHIMVIWQSIATFVGAFAIFALTEKEIISIDIATTLVILICGWLLAHLYDSAYWYNRNLVIIANIERQFLIQKDLKEIHYYFGKHRPNNKMIMHLRIQYLLGLSIGSVVLLFHLWTRIKPDIFFPPDFNYFDFPKSLPYIATFASTYFLISLRSHRKKSYLEFLGNSPGLEIDTTGIKYGLGHGFPDMNKDDNPSTEED